MIFIVWYLIGILGGTVATYLLRFSWGADGYLWSKPYNWTELTNWNMLAIALMGFLGPITCFPVFVSLIVTFISLSDTAWGKKPFLKKDKS